MAASVIHPYTFVALRLPSGLHKVLKIAPDTSIQLGKWGTFNTNSLLGRPLYLTYEIVQEGEDAQESELRIISASELHAEVLADSMPTSREANGSDGAPSEVDPTDVAGDNRLTVDDATRQALTMEEIEQLKKADTGSGKEIIAKLMQSHSGIDQKTAFSLSKYTLRKRQKYMKRFVALPLDVSKLTQWMLEEKEPARIMEIREETLGLIASYSNVHCGGSDDDRPDEYPNGRWLIVDDTAGLVVAAMAERMGLLHPSEEILAEHLQEREEAVKAELEDSNTELHPIDGEEDSRAPQERPEDEGMHNGYDCIGGQATTQAPGKLPETRQETNGHRKMPKRHPPDAMSATNNTITLLHPAAQPNHAMLSYFSFDPSDTTSQNSAIPSAEHPLHRHLKTLNFLQLIQPELDGSYEEPEVFPDDEIKTWKPSQRGNYWRKRRRWERVKRVVDEARAGDFDGVVLATAIAPASILHHTVPLLKGGGQVVVYSPNIEPLAELADMYSSARKTAFLGMLAREDEEPPVLPSDDFPVDPRLLLAPTIQTARARAWQVLPGRTHPIMTSRGGAEGYLFTATRVLPAEGKVQARGNFSKKRKGTEEAAIAVEPEMKIPKTGRDT